MMAPGIPSLWQFKVGKDVFTLSYSYEPGQQKEKLVIESMTMDLRDVILLTIEDSMAEYAREFMLPLCKISGDELTGKLRTCFKELAGAGYPQSTP
jgi:hypothetical protein